MIYNSIKGSRLTKLCHRWQKGMLKFLADLPVWFCSWWHSPSMLQAECAAAVKLCRRGLGGSSRSPDSHQNQRHHRRVGSPSSRQPPWHKTMSIFIVSLSLLNKGFSQAWKCPETGESGLMKSNKRCAQSTSCITLEPLISIFSNVVASHPTPTPMWSRTSLFCLHSTTYKDNSKGLI